MPSEPNPKKRPRTSTGSVDEDSTSTTGSTRIRILCRVRPFLKHETTDDCITLEDRTVRIVNQRNPAEAFRYEFDACYDAQASQSDLFQRDVRPLVDNIFKGLDATMFCYGVTGAGKTHTVQGDAQNPGLIPRTVEYLFTNKRMRNKLKYSVAFTYFEIYKESVFDLLVPRDHHSSSGLPIREDAHHNIFIPNLTEQSIASYSEFQRAFQAACRNRSTASTKLNVASSRSHAVLTVQITWHDAVRNADLRGRVHLIDLAGSEDNRRTENGKDRMAESGAINKSLFVLGQVVEALNTGAQRIPYRDSKMTRILQQSLGGRSLGMMIVNVAPGQKFYLETYNTLNFATKSKTIVNNARVHAVAATPMEPQYGAVGLGKARRGSGADVAAGPDPARKRVKVAPPHATAEHRARPGVAKVHPRLSGSRLSDSQRSQPPPGRGGPTGPYLMGRKLEDFEAVLESKVERIMEKKARELKGQTLQLQANHNAPLAGAIRPPANTTVPVPAAIDPSVQERLVRLEMRLAAQPNAEGILDLLSPTTKHKNAQAYVKRGKLLEKQGHIEEALIHFERAAEFVPDRDTLLKYIQKLKRKHGAGAGSKGGSGGGNQSTMPTAVMFKFTCAPPDAQENNPRAANTTATTTTATNMAPVKVTAKRARQNAPLLQRLLAAAEEPDVNDSGDDDDSGPFTVATTAAQRASRPAPRRSGPPIIPPDLSPMSIDDGSPSSTSPHQVNLANLTCNRGSLSMTATTTTTTGAAVPAAYATLPAKARRTESEVLTILNGGDLRMIMALKGIGKKRAEQIREFVHTEGPLGGLAELAFIGFKESVLKKLLEAD
ncbi:hypothetical protein IWQ60_006090 [Tieghemiomyces parasiticus]|uniref:Kinesin-like protein n=1 Tax=Tieghemiomyces parasiticus TaxID=78921 RepID=A0A9W8A509_9FUNG|nr:hypothetical protein IWQ60_006090 [Tieghemiomyces parasiticus]